MNCFFLIPFRLVFVQSCMEFQLYLMKCCLCAHRVHVERLGIITDKDVQTDRIQADETVQGLFYTYLTWQSEPNRLGFTQICFYAVSTDG